MIINCRPKFFISDINECQRHIDDCDEHMYSSCNNTIGTYECPCDSGYEDDNNGGCIGKFNNFDDYKL